MLASQFHQGIMPGVQIAHGRHEADAATLLFPTADARAQGAKVAVGLHQA
jgi:hypothetical protein